MKKLISILLAGTMAVGAVALSGCSQTKAENNEKTVNSSENQSSESKQYDGRIEYENCGNYIKLTKFDDEQESDEYTLPNEIDGLPVEEIQYYFMRESMAPKHITLPNTVKTIGDHAFYESAIEEIVLPASLRTVDDYAFSDINKDSYLDIKGLKSVKMEEGVETFGNSVFQDCDQLETVEMADTITKVGNGMLFSCESLKSVKISKGLKELSIIMFAGCTSLTEITIPEGVTTIRTNCFGGCTSLSKVTLPSTLKTIESRAFSNCENLTEITIPENVTEIAEDTFDNEEGKENNRITIYGKSGSAAEEFAKSRSDITFVAI